jgi:hypothetical protein
MSIYLFVKCYGVAIENGAFDAVFSDSDIILKGVVIGACIDYFEHEVNTADEQGAYPLHDDESCGY